MAYLVMAFIVMAEEVSFLVMAFTIMAFIVMVHILMAYIVMAQGVPFLLAEVLRRIDRRDASEFADQMRWQQAHTLARTLCNERAASVGPIVRMRLLVDVLQEPIECTDDVVAVRRLQAITKWAITT